MRSMFHSMPSTLASLVPLTAGGSGTVSSASIDATSERAAIFAARALLPVTLTVLLIQYDV